jgi:hypothetical protein
MMTPDERECMRVLCERIVEEKDYQKFIELVEVLNNLLDGKAQRLEDRATKGMYRGPN